VGGKEEVKEIILHTLFDIVWMDSLLIVKGRKGERRERCEPANGILGTLVACSDYRNNWQERGAGPEG